MVEKFVSPGDKIEMRSLVDAVLPDGSQGVKVYNTKVYDLKDDDHIEILMPLEHTKLVLLPVGYEYDVCFFSKGGIYRTTLRVTDRQKDEGMYILIAELTSNLHKFQRREYYRFNCLVDVETRLLSDDETKSVEGGKPEIDYAAPMIDGVIVDISGGGARFLTTAPLIEGRKIILKFKLSIMDVDRPFLLLANILYSKKIENRPGHFENRVKYEYISNSTREEIIRYIFDEERKNRKMR
jgi:c-di-GMP-binding flagellar brake protein YcgR